MRKTRKIEAKQREPRAARGVRAGTWGLRPCASAGARDRPAPRAFPSRRSTRAYATRVAGCPRAVAAAARAAGLPGPAQRPAGAAKPTRLPRARPAAVMRRGRHLLAAGPLLSGRVLCSALPDDFSRKTAHCSAGRQGRTASFSPPSRYGGSSLDTLSI